MEKLHELLSIDSVRSAIIGQAKKFIEEEEDN
jgi:hypothetical protein